MLTLCSACALLATAIKPSRCRRASRGVTRLVWLRKAPTFSQNGVSFARTIYKTLKARQRDDALFILRDILG